MSITTYWRIPPENFLFKLAPGNVHVWRAPLDDSPERASRFRLYLSDDEITRADQYPSPHPQYQFVVTRGILRTLLSRYVGVAPAQLDFETHRQGKPMLVSPSSLPIQFNVTHSQGMALIALTLQHAIGIDVEWTDRAIQEHAIAERFFSERESADLASLPAGKRTRRFFWYWTCKEAYLKMQGRGIAGGLAECQFSIEPNQPKVRLALLDQPGQKGEYSLYRIDAGAKHVGAVAIACHSAQISYWKWQDNDPA